MLANLRGCRLNSVHKEAQEANVVQNTRTNALEGKLIKTFWDYSREDPGRTAIVDGDGRIWTRREVRRGALRIADWLRRRGVGVGAAVAIAAPNSAEFLIAHLAITSCGAWAVPVNYHLISDEIWHVISLSKVRWALADASLMNKIEDAVRQDAEGIEVIDLRRLIEEVGDPSDIFERNIEVAFRHTLGRTMLFTSATTGKPKAVIFRGSGGYQSLARQIAFRVAAGTKEDSDAVHLCASMLYFVGPLESAVVTLHMGNTTVLMRFWSAHGALRVIERCRVTEAFLVPIMVTQLSKLTSEERAAYDVSSLRMIVHAGAPCPMFAKRCLIDWLGPIVCESYGATEGGGTFVTSEEWLRYPGTVGRPIPGAIITIRGAAGEELPAGREGRVYISSYTGDRFEYLDDPGGTERCFVGDQFTVGDIGFLNGEGYLFILDRAVNMINYGGANLYPAEIEGAISAHPYVDDCAVVARSSDRHGEAPHALIERSRNCFLSDDQLKADITRFLVSRLAPAKLPHSYEFVESVPRSSGGKLRKRDLVIHKRAERSS